MPNYARRILAERVAVQFYQAVTIAQGMTGDNQDGNDSITMSDNDLADMLGSMLMG